MSKSFFLTLWKRKVEVLLIVVLFSISFFRLGETKFLHDEAEVGMVGKQVLRTGLPLAEDADGILPVAMSNDFHTSRSPHLYRWQTWLMFYVAAASMAVGGATQFAARFPFVCFGLITLWFLYLVAKELLGSKVAKMATVLVGFSAQYIVLIREARYYSLIMCFGTVSLFFFLRSMKQYFYHNPKQVRTYYPELGYLLSMVLLFHSQYLSFMGIFIGYGLCFFGLSLKHGRVKFSRESILWYIKQPFLWVNIAVLLLTLPWILVFRKGISGDGLFSVIEMLQNILSLVMKVNSTLPILLLAGGVFVTFCATRRKITQTTPYQVFGLSTILMLTCSSLLLVAITVAMHLPPSFAAEFRYILAVYPLLFIFVAAAFLRILERSKIVGVLFFVIVLGSNLLSLPLELNVPATYSPLSQSKLSLRSYLFEYIGIELANGYIGPVDSILSFLKMHAHPDQKIFTTLEGISLKFDLPETRIDNTYSFSTKFDRPMNPDDLLAYDWVILRTACSSSCVGLSEAEVSTLLSEHYIKHELPVFDYIVNNREEIPYHYFASPTQEPHVVIYERREGVEGFSN